MKKQLLRSVTSLHGLSRQKMRIGLCILLLTICSTARSQPTMVSQISNASKNYVEVNGSLYYSAGDSLFKASSPSVPILVKETGQPILSIHNITLGSTFFFVTQNGSAQSLWRSDGTAANTVQLLTQPQITPLLAYHSQLFLKINATATGIELWKMDASYNATLLKDINPGSANGFVGNLIIHNDLLYFFANAGTPVPDLWRSDGTTAGTVMSVDLDDTDYYNTSGFRSLTSVGTVIFFTRSYEGDDWGNRYAELWKSDGTPEGTTMVIQYTDGYFYNDFYHLTVFNGKLYFFHDIGDPSYTYLSVSDGTTAGTQHLQLLTIDGGAMAMVNAGSYLVFYGASQGFNTPIKKFDGTTISEVHQFSRYHGATADIIDLTYANGRAFFIDDVDAYYDNGQDGNSHLWQADLATGTTQPVQDIYNVPLTNSSNITAANGSVYFTRIISNQLTLWYYDPSKTVVPSVCETAGFIEREKWLNITGYSISSIPVTTQPNSIGVLPNFSTPQNNGDNYGARVRGYVCVPENGNYVFYISSDDNSELWLSTDDDPANKKLIASSKWTNYNEWNKYPSQQSAAIPLVKGNKYYIEALHKEATGADHLSVGWKLPNGTLERPIAGIRLTPFKRNNPPTVYITQPSDNATFIAPATINIAASAWDYGGSVTKVSFYSGGTLLGEDLTSPYTYQWQNVSAGNYTIEAKATDNEGFTKSDFQSVIVSPPCSGTGNMYREIWVNAPGTDVRLFDFSTKPNGGGNYYNTFETEQYYSNSYASRMRGWLCVPQSGNYTLWISSDDYSELYLSTDDTEANKQLIAWVYGATPFRNYDKYTSQKSGLITLQAGRKYYVEARHKEGSGNDFISVGWQLPDGTLELPIPGNRLIPMLPVTNDAPAITITNPQPNQDFSSPASINIAANVTDPDGVKSVKFVVLYGSTTTTLATFSSPPYEYQWNNVQPGSYQLLVEASDNLSAGTSQSIFFSVDKTTCAGAGKIYREIWTGIPGTSVSSIPTSSPPNAIVELTSFGTSNYYGNDYGSRIRGYVCAPASGNYKFRIASDDNSELWLSDNDDPANKHKIAYVIGATAVNQWNKFSSQASAYVTLVQGQRYYIEVLHKEGSGADHVEVGWELPQGGFEAPIPGNRLIPFEDPSASTASAELVSIFDSGESNLINLYPNPTSNHQTQMTVAPEAVNNFEMAKVEIITTTGTIVHSQEIDCTQNCNDVLLSLDQSLPPGVYMVNVHMKDKKFSRRLFVK